MTAKKIKARSTRRFDLDTREKRRQEQNYRARLISEEQCKVLLEKYPRLYNTTRATAERRVAERRGPLPGDEETSS